MSVNRLYAVGIDLAWSGRNRSGIAALCYDSADRSARLIGVDWLLSDADIVAWVAANVPDAAPLVVGIDAPLSVPNQTGSRVGDRAITAAYGRREAGAYPANRTLLGRYNGGIPRGEALLAALAPLHIDHNPEFPTQQTVHTAFEVYPHAAMVGLFDLERTLKYKRGPLAERAAALSVFANYLTNLDTFEPALKLNTLEPALWPFAIPPAPHKQREDQLDALLCGYMALYYWYWGLTRCQIFGSVAEGYIVAPRFAGTQG